MNTRRAEIELARKLLALLNPAQQLALSLGEDDAQLILDAGLGKVTDKLAPILARLRRIGMEPGIKAALRTIEQVQRSSEQAWIEQARAASIRISRTPAEAALIKAAAKRSSALITSIPAQLADEVGAQVAQAIAEGRSTLDLGKLIAERTGIAQRRAQLIARNEIGTVNAELAQTRQQAAGVTQYRWRTSRDERVRPEHAARDRQVFSWDDPPEGGHPGEAINCRCIALPILDT